MNNVAFIHPFLNRLARGIERYTVNLSNALIQQGTFVDIMTWRWQQTIIWEELDTRVCVQTYPTSRYYAATAISPFFVWHLLRHRYDHLYVFFAEYGEALTLNTLARLRRNQPFSIVLHFPYPQVPHRYHSFVRSGLVEQAKEVIAVSQFVADEAQPILGRSCRVIGHGVDMDRFHPNTIRRANTRQKLKVPQDAPILLTVSALEERKGVKWVLSALPLLLHQFPDLTYLIVGDGPYRDQLSWKVESLGLQSNVIFLPATTEVVSYYQASDIKLILSKGEASSIVALEAMACGLPVIAATYPPFDELIHPDWGIQVDPTDPNCVAEAISILLNNPRRCQQMGVAGQTQIKNEHTWDSVANSYAELVESAR